MLKTLKQKLTSGQHWVKDNWLLTFLILGGVWWFWPESEIHFPEVVQESYRANQVASFDVAESVAAPALLSRSLSKSRVPNISLPVAEAQDFDPNLDDRKVIKNGNLNIEVPSPEALRETVEAKIKSLEAYISNLNSWEVRPGVLGYNFTVRVPAEKFEQALAELAALGVKKSESFNEQDITSQYQDTEAQIANLKVRRDGLRDLLERRTNKLSDLLSVDRELSQVQQQIERLERTQKTRDNQVSYSVINFSVQPEPQIGDVANPHWSVDRSWRQSVNKLIVALQDIADRGIYLVVFAPIWLPLLVLFYFGRRFWKKRKGKKQTNG